jgi:LytR cell envelope-related transcriptional attenuator
MSQRRSSTSTPARPTGTSTAVTIVVVVVTALLGLFILNKINDSSSASGSSGSESPGTQEPGDTSGGSTTSSSVPAVDMSTAKVLVANGAGVKGLAGTTTTALQAAFPTASFLPATDANAKYTQSAVYYKTGFESQAGEIATSLGLTPSGLFPPALPLKDPTKIGAANILVLLGADKAAGATVTPPGGAAAPPTTVAPTTAAPPTTT